MNYTHLVILDHIVTEAVPAPLTEPADSLCSDGLHVDLSGPQRQVLLDLAVPRWTLHALVPRGQVGNRAGALVVVYVTCTEANTYIYGSILVYVI